MSDCIFVGGPRCPLCPLGTVHLDSSRPTDGMKATDVLKLPIRTFQWMLMDGLPKDEFERGLKFADQSPTAP